MPWTDIGPHYATQKIDESTDVSDTVGNQELVEAGGTQVDYSFIFPEEPMIPAEMVDGLKPEEMEQSDPQPTTPEEIPAFTREFENKDSLVVNGETITLQSSVVLLRAAAEFLGVNKNGSKKALWSRINQRAQSLEHEQMFVEANRLHREGQ